MTHAHMKLGRRPARHDPRTLRLSSYIDLSRLPASPVAVEIGAKVAHWPMFANDECGDCTIAAAAHMVEAWISDAQHREARITTGRVLAEYERLTGYNPKTGDNDNGAVELDVLRAWQSGGLMGHKVEAFVSVDHRREDLVHAATWLFGGLYAGVALPLSAQSQTDAWSVPASGAVGDGAPGSWGGHAVPILGSKPGQLDCITWGKRLPMTSAFFATYFEEASAVLSLDWLKDGTCPPGLDLEHLRADLALLKAA